MILDSEATVGWVRVSRHSVNEMKSRKTTPIYEKPFAAFARDDEI
jgi:hypothetical protein